MSTDLRRHNRLCLDAAMRRACSSLSNRHRAAFLQLAIIVRARSTVMATPPGRDGGFVQVEALRNLARFRFIREPSAWSGASGHPLHVIHSLASHLLARYPVPRFLASVWFGADDAAGREKRRWFVEHGNGTPLRRVMQKGLTRAMEHELLRSCDHVSVEYALRYAEVIGLGGTHELAREVCASRLGKELDNAELWRSAMIWFVNLGEELVLVQVGPIVDYLQAVRNERARIQTPEGSITRRAPQPTFSLKGRTFASVMRLVATWHASLPRTTRVYSWHASRWNGLVYETDAKAGLRMRWTMVNLTNSDQLRREGRAMRHCVGGYVWQCKGGTSEIWSLRRLLYDPKCLAHENEGTSCATIEIAPRTGTIVQIRGSANSRLTGQPLELVQMWASRERLSMGSAMR